MTTFLVLMINLYKEQKVQLSRNNYKGQLLV